MSKIKDFLKKKHEIKKSILKIKCPSCSSVLYKSGDENIKGCMCFGFSSVDEKAKVRINKTENGISLDFNRSWDEDNIQMLMDIITKSK